MISGINKISIYVDDQQAALEFWRDRCGFTVTTDATHDDYRWIEVASPNGAVVLAVLQHIEGAERIDAHVPADQPTFAAMLATDDLQATHAELVAAGVEFLADPVEHFWGWWSMFTDGQGNRIALVPTGQ